MKLIGNPKLMATSLSNLVDNLTERINKSKCKDCDYFLEYKSAKESLIKFNVHFAIKIIQIKLMEN